MHDDPPTRELPIDLDAMLREVAAQGLPSPIAIPPLPTPALAMPAHAITPRMPPSVMTPHPMPMPRAFVPRYAPPEPQTTPLRVVLLVVIAISLVVTMGALAHVITAGRIWLG